MGGQKRAIDILYLCVILAAAEIYSCFYFFMLDNSKLIRPLLKFTDEYSFYYVQILARRKDNPEMSKGVRTIKELFITSLEEFDEDLDRIEVYCKAFNARAYINLNVRNFKDLALRFNAKIADFLISGSYKMQYAYSTVAGMYSSDPDKKWIIDLDGDEADNVEAISAFIESIPPVEKTKVITTIPTKNGVHLISRPFNRIIFEDKYSKIDIHKDNPTILYIP